MDGSVRERDGVQMVDVALPRVERDEGFDRKTCVGMRVSQDGERMALWNESEVEVWNPRTNQNLRRLDVHKVVAVHFSPEQKYLLTLQKPRAEGVPEKNLRVWNLETGDCAFQTQQKTYNKEDWPYLQWSSDGKTAIKLVNNEVHCYDCPGFGEGQPARRMRVENVSGFSCSPGPMNHVAVYVPEIKGAPASAQLYNHAEFPVKVGSSTPQPLGRRNFFRSMACEFRWAPKTGSACLVLAVSDVDATNKSYYGEQSLHFIAADGSKDCKVDLQKEGPVYDVQWSPHGTHFVAVYGFMPARATLFDAKCNPVFEFGSGPRNIVRWSPLGRFLCLAGFGNLPGDVEMFQKGGDGNCRPIGYMRTHCAVHCEWAPDGRHILTSTVSPRLRVDNGYKMWKYTGELVHEYLVDELYQTEWIPAQEDTYEDRPISPNAKKIARALESGDVGGTGKAEPYRPPGAKQAPYRPPHANANRSEGPKFCLARDENDKPGKVQPFRPKAAASTVPGAEFQESVSKTAERNRKRRAKKKELESQQNADDLAKEVQNTKVSDQEVTDPAKKMRNLQKKLRQIGELKAKAASVGSHVLTPEQQAKIQSEGEIRGKIAELGGQ